MAHGNKILFVDDEPLILSSLKRETQGWMEDADLEFVQAGSVDEGIQILETSHEDFLVVVSDLKMPNKKGNELLSVVQQRWPLISTILLTGFSDIEELKSCIQAGIIAFIQKPWDSDFLRSEILRGVETSRLKSNNQNYLRELEKELGWAKKINEVLLLPDFTAKGIKNIGLSYKAHAQSSCGGDFFRVYIHNGDDVVACLGDISVEGVQGTYLSLVIRDELDKIMASMADKPRINPGEVLEKLNNRIISMNLSLPDTIMTLSVLSVESSEQRVVFACAGGEEFYVIRNRMIHRHHLPSPGLGYHQNIMFSPKSIAFNSGDLVFLCSDGISKALGYSDYIQGMAMDTDPAWPAQSMAEHAMGIITGTVKNLLTDDATIMVIKHE